MTLLTVLLLLCYVACASSLPNQPLYISNDINKMNSIVTKTCSSTKSAKYYKSLSSALSATATTSSTISDSKTTEPLEYFRDRFSIAPMMDYTDRFQRKFHRLLSRHTVLYTEMVTSHALDNSPHPERYLAADFSVEEPVVLQLGGSDPMQLQRASKIAVKYGYKDINLNVGCPSEKVSDKGCFGAVLMLQPQLVGEICQRIGEVMQKMPTVKCRIGVDDHDSYEELTHFIHTVHAMAGVNHFIIHARKAILGGKFTPTQNRNIPPLRYEVVYQLKKDFPSLKFTLNGGVLTLAEAKEHLLDNKVDGVMVGRAAINDPYSWTQVDSQLYGADNDPNLTRRQLLQQYCEFLDQEISQYSADNACWSLKHLNTIRRFGLKPVFNLFHGESNGKMFRQLLSDGLVTATKQTSAAILPSTIVQQAISVLSDDVLDQTKTYVERSNNLVSGKIDNNVVPV